MSAFFYNPYQFIPVDTRKAKATTPYANAKGGLKTTENRFVRHDYWCRGGVSGRIICSLTTLSPLVVGAEQEASQGNNQAGRVLPYLDLQGNPAIPASSLRGLIASVTEAISQSSLRVLMQAEKGVYSVRKPAQSEALGEEFSALKYIGLVYEADDGYKLYPLTDESHDGIFVGDYLDDSMYFKCCEKKKKKNPKIICPSNNRTLRRSEVDLIRERNCFHLDKNNLIDEYQGDPGVFYIRGKNDPLCKRSEQFLPWDGSIDPEKLLLIEPAAVEVLENILRTISASEKNKDVRVKKQKEMLPVGYAGHKERVWEVDNQKSTRQPLVLHGDLIRYRKEKDTNGDYKVVEISYSSIWRKAVPGDLYESFIKHSGPDSVPWNPDREALTPAEALFGVTEDQPDNERRGGARNLASRLRFTDAIAQDAIQLENEVTLKILNSPKPPSPAMYFGAKAGYFEKTRLNLGIHSPNGRKIYLPHPQSLQDQPEANWVSEADQRLHMHLRCTPIPAKKEFIFEIHFENLAPEELGLLLTALEPAREGQQYVHRLGLGKPLGLGHVQLRAKVETLNRQQRYSVRALREKTPRYESWQGTPDLSLVDTARALPVLRQSGDPSSLVNIKTGESLPVCYPFDSTNGQTAHDEGEGFKWFGTNDRAAKDATHQALGKVVPGKPLTPLKS